VQERLEQLVVQQFTFHYKHHHLQNMYRSSEFMRSSTMSDSETFGSNYPGNTSNVSTLTSGVGGFIKERLSRFAALGRTPTNVASPATNCTNPEMDELRVHTENSLNISVEHVGEFETRPQHQLEILAVGEPDAVLITLLTDCSVDGEVKVHAGRAKFVLGES